MNPPPAEDRGSTPPSSRKARPFSALQALVRANATGELISSLEGGEVHVFLQSGKVVWATSTHSLSNFRHHGLNPCGISKKEMVSVLAETQQTKRPLAETLRSRGFAGKEVLRAAYIAQMAEPIFALRSAKAGESVFLGRKTPFNHADPSLMFSLSELL